MPKEIDGTTYYTKDEVYMDQSEVNKAIQDRISRVEKKPEDYDELKAQVRTLTENLAERNNALAERDTALKSKDKELADAIEAAKQEQRDELIPELNKAKVRNAAILKGFRNPDDAVTFYGDIPADLTDEGITNRLAEIATERNYLLSTPENHSAADAGIGVSGSGKAPSEPGMARIESALEPK